MTTLDVTLDELAAGGDAVGRDANGRVTFVPRGAPGDRVRLRLTKQTKSFARGEIAELLAPSPARIEPPCPAFVAGCGGCSWQHVTRAAQLAAKQQTVERALRRVGATVHPIEDPCAPYGWRRRARFHVVGGRIGLFAEGTHRLIPLRACPQLEPALDRELAQLATRALPDGEVAMVVGGDGAVATSLDDREVQLDEDLRVRPYDFAQASAAGDRALRARAAAALGPGPGRLLELHAGAGNLTRAFAAAGWDVVPTDVVTPAHPPAGFITARADAALDMIAGALDAIALDPPRTGAAEVIAGIVKRAPATIIYVSCDPATLARDVEALIKAGYRATDAWPLDLMPQTAHVEVVVRIVR